MYCTRELHTQKTLRTNLCTLIYIQSVLREDADKVYKLQITKNERKNE